MAMFDYRPRRQRAAGRDGIFNAHVIEGGGVALAPPRKTALHGHVRDRDNRTRADGAKSKRKTHCGSRNASGEIKFRRIILRFDVDPYQEKKVRGMLIGDVGGS
jgi:hypothetical protein